MDYDLVLSGSGVRLIAFVGALKRFEAAGLRPRHICGTSGGAIIGALLAAGYTPDELQAIVFQIDFDKFKDINWSSPLSGIYKGDHAYKLIRHLLDAKHVRTFEKLNHKLHVVATDLNHNKAVVFGDNDPKMEVARAVRMSMSIPIFYTSWKHKKCNMDDGGLVANYPIDIFDQDMKVPTIGFRIFDKTAALPNKIYGGWNPLKRFLSLQNARITTLLRQQDYRHIEDKDWSERTVKIDGLGISGVDFKITQQERLALFMSGFQAAENFLATHPSYSAAHRSTVPA